MSESAPPPQANPPLRRARRGGRVRRRLPGPLRLVWDSIAMGWRWLTRMRTALYLLGILGLLSLVATFVPQEPNVPSTVAEWRRGEAGPGAAVSQVLDAVGAFDVYGSAVFLALLLLLYLSLTACLIPRIRAWIRLVRRSRPPVVRRVGAHDQAATFTTDASPEHVQHTAERLLSRRRWRVRPHPGPAPATQQGVEPGPQRNPAPAQVAGEKGLYTREGGSLLFHLSFYVLLAAIVFGQLLTFEGQRGVIEGEAGFRDTAVSYWDYRPGRWFGEEDHAGWRLELDEFHVDWVRDPTAPGAGQATEFRSDVTITPADGSSSYQATIDSNEPLTVDGRQITQLDWGYAPRVVVEVDGEVVHDDFLTPNQDDSGAYRGAVKAPAADPDVGLDVFLYPFAPDDEETGRPVPTGAPWAEAPMLLFRQYRGDLQLGATQQTANELDTSQLRSEGGAWLRPGQEIEVDGVVVSFPELRRWVGYQVSSRPAVPALLGGATLLVGGLVAALYAYRRRLWVLTAADAEAGRTLVTVAGRAFQRPDAFVGEHQRLTAELADALDGSTPQHHPGPDDTPDHDRGPSATPQPPTGADHTTDDLDDRPQVTVGGPADRAHDRPSTDDPADHEVTRP
ncbi:MAG: cytochrome c biogenesis protein ResB [Actinomycetota bacterium]